MYNDLVPIFRHLLFFGLYGISTFTCVVTDAGSLLLLFNKYLLSIHYVRYCSNTGDTTMNKTNSLCPHRAYTTVERDKYIHIHKIMLDSIDVTKEK